MPCAIGLLSPLHRLEEVLLGSPNPLTCLLQQKISLYEKEQKSREIEDLVTWFLREALAPLAQHPLVEICQVQLPAPRSLLPLFGPQALLQEQQYLVREWRGVAPKAPLSPLLHGPSLHGQRLYVMAGGIALPLSPCILLAPCATHQHQEIFLYQGGIVASGKRGRFRISSKNKKQRNQAPRPDPLQKPAPNNSALSPFYSRVCYQGSEASCSLDWQTWALQAPAAAQECEQQLAGLASLLR